MVLMSINVVLADDHKVLRHGLSEAVKNEDGMEVIGQAGNGRQAVSLAKKLSPDIIIMDIAMPDLNGIEATRQILKENPHIKIIALSMHPNRKLIHEMFKAGAKGYLLKDCEYEELISAVRIVMKGKIYLSPSITGVVVDNYLLSSDADKDGAFTMLSDREREVLQLIAEGKTTKQIALKLHVSPKTVEGHRTRIMHKLDIDNIANLTKYAIQEGLTSPDVS
jgi:DNA-binding NarL/FixJ family response regulator